MPRGVKKIKIPQVDLSKYSDSENIPIHIEKIILEALIIFKMDIQKVSEYFNISEDIVNGLTIEYYSTLTAIYNNQIQTKVLDETLNDAANILSQHVSEIKKSQKNSNIKTLRQQDLNGLCKTIDKISLVRSEATKAYDTTINKLISNITDIKVSEAKISGPVEDDSGYLDNQNTVANMIKEFSSKKEKKITLVNVKTYETKTFTSYKEADEFLGCNGHLRDVAARKYPYKEEWLVNIAEE